MDVSQHQITARFALVAVGATNRNRRQIHRSLAMPGRGNDSANQEIQLHAMRAGIDLIQSTAAACVALL